MSIFDDILADDAENCFTNSDEFGERCIYHNYLSGESRDIYADVDRNPSEAIPDAGISSAQYFLLSVANSKTAGIAAEELDRGTDTIEVKERIGGTFKTYKIKTIKKQDAGMLLLRVE